MQQLTDGITLLSGKVFDYNNPAACPVDIIDIAQPQSNICRFAGQLPYFYSVAQHCVNASYIVAEEFAFDTLMHDTAESFTNDIVTPLKVAVPLFKELEQKIEAAMGARFGFRYPLPEAVKVADLQMLALEMRVIRGQDTNQHQVLKGVEYAHLLDMPGLDLTSWTPRRAYAEFMRRFGELGGYERMAA